MSADTRSELAQALAYVQAELPHIVKGETAEVPTKNGGSYSYSYADLASISEQLLPLLAAHNLAFIAKPTVTDAGAFVLAYSLLHASGEREDGNYPLPTNGTPQQVGSAITYARRYVLCAVTGVAPEDDDGQAAEQAARAPAPAPAADPHKDRIVKHLRERDIPLTAFGAYLASEGFEMWDEVPDNQKSAMADGVTKGVLLDDIKRFVKEPA